MGWFNGTFKEKKEIVSKLFPNQLADNLFIDSFNRRVAIIFDEDLLIKDKRYITVQPYDSHNKSVLFYFPFFGKNVPAIAEYIKNNCIKVPYKKLDDQLDELYKILADEYNPHKR